MAEQKEELWSIEHTILHLEQMKETLIKKVGSGACVDWKEKGINAIRFDFDRAIKVLKQQIKPQPAAVIKTNEDKIRNMPLEGLARMLPCPYDTAGEQENIMPCIQVGEDPESTQRCYSCIKAWLQKEVRNGEIKTSKES